MVWHQKDVGDFINKTFVSLRITPSDSEWEPIAKKLNARGHPIAVFLKSNGEEIDRICGFEGDKDKYLQTIKDYSVGKNAISVYLAQLEKNPESVDLNFKVGKRYVDRMQLDQAQPYMAKVLALDPEDKKGFKTEATYSIAEFQLRYKKNITPMQEFLRNFQNETFLPQGYALLAMFYLGQNEKEKMVETYEEAINRFPENPRLKLSYASNIFRARMESRYKKGHEISKELIASDSDANARMGYFLLLQHARATKNVDQMFEAYEQAILRFPSASEFLEGYAKDVYKKKRSDKYDRAIELAKKALEIKPNSSKVWDTLGRLYREKGNLEKAVAAMEKAVEIEPKNKEFARLLEKYRKEISQ